MKFTEKILMTTACTILGMALTFCSSSRELAEDELKVPPKLYETAFNMIQTKLARYNIQDKVIVEIDSVRSIRQFDWAVYPVTQRDYRIRPNAEDKFTIRYKMRVRNKPYFNVQHSFTLQDSGQLYAAKYTTDSLGIMQDYRMVSDTALESVGIVNLNSLNEAYLPMRFEEADALVRKTVGLSENIPCVYAFPSKDVYYDCCYDSARSACEGTWYLVFLLEPSDTTLYYHLKTFGLEEQEIQRDLQQRKYRPEDGCYGNCPATLLYCRVNAERKEICYVGVSIRFDSCFSGDQFDHPNLSPLFKRVRAVQDSLNVVHSSLKFDK